jgi:CubicO group peptidase (beta-lactamase class C family)
MLSKTIVTANNFPLNCCNLFANFEFPSQISMKSILIIPLFILGSVAAVAQQPAVSSRLDSLIGAANQMGVFNGVALVAESGKVIYQQAFGYTNAGKDRLLSTDMHFYIGSISKEFNSTGIVRLAEEGKLSLDDSVSRYVTGLPAWGDSIKIRNLLDYTSGLPQLLDAGSTEAWQQAFEALPKLSFRPGTAYIYSNANIYMQQRIIEKVTGMLYDDFVGRHLLAPLGLKDIRIDTLSHAGIPASFDNAGKATAGLDSATEMVVTAQDLYRWATYLENGKVVSPAGLAVLSKSFGGNESSLGTAKVDGGRLVLHAHQGSGYNYECLLYQQENPEIVVILLTNNQEFKVNELKDGIVNLLQHRSYHVPKRSIYLDLRTKVLTNFDQGIAFYEQIKKDGQDRYDFSQPEVDLFNTAKYLMRRQRYEDAIRILDLSTLVDVHNTGSMSYAFGLIGECYRKKNEPVMALVYYKKAAELDPTNLNASGMLQELSGEQKQQ